MSWRHHKIQLSRAENCYSLLLFSQLDQKRKKRERMIFRDVIFRLFEIYITDGSSRELEKVWNVGRRRWYRRQVQLGKLYTCQLHKSFCFSLSLLFIFCLVIIIIIIVYTCDDDDPFSLYNLKTTTLYSVSCLLKFEYYDYYLLPPTRGQHHKLGGRGTTIKGRQG